MHEGDEVSSGWGTAGLWYGLAVLLVIIAVIVLLWRFFSRCDDESKEDRERYNNLILCLWLAAVVFGVLALVQQNYDARK